LQEDRAPALSESTLCFARRYGIPCRRVRYSLSGSTVFLVGEYDIPCRRVRYSLSDGTVLSSGGRVDHNHCFCRTFVNGGLWDVQPVSKVGADLQAGTVFFVGEDGIDLLDGTVFRRRWMRAVLVGGYGILRRRSPASKALSKALCLGRSARSNLLWDHDRWRRVRGTNPRNPCT
jgi:hypothetical protein